MTDRVYRVVNRVVAAGFRLAGYRFTVTGAEHIPVSGPAVLAANHTSFLDFTLVGYAARRRGRLVRFLCKASMFDVPVVGWSLRRMRHIPVQRRSGAVAFRHGLRALEAGEVVGVFPEATISRSWLLRRPFKPGASGFALKRGVPLIPVVTWGGHRILTVDGRRSLRRRVPITIVVGEPLEPTGSIEELTRRLDERLEALLAAAVEEYPQRPALGEDAWWWPHELGGSAPDRETAARLDLEGIARVGDSFD